MATAGRYNLYDPPMRHTRALRASRWQRLHFRILGYWPDSFVRARLIASDLDAAELRRRMSRSFGG